MNHVGPSWSTTWRTHSCVPCRDSSRHLLCSLTRSASHARGPGVEKSLDAARRSACATSATTCPTLAHSVSSTSGGLSLGRILPFKSGSELRSKGSSRRRLERAIAMKTPALFLLVTLGSLHAEAPVSFVRD